MKAFYSMHGQDSNFIKQFLARVIHKVLLVLILCVAFALLLPANAKYHVETHKQSSQRDLQAEPSRTRPRPQRDPCFCFWVFFFFFFLWWTHIFRVTEVAEELEEVDGIIAVVIVVVVVVNKNNIFFVVKVRRCKGQNLFFLL